MLVATVVAEAMFWACLVLGCVFRYTLKMPRTGIVLLAATPVIDLLLLVFSYITLSQSGAAEFMHGFAAFYIAFSIVFGRSIIHAFDRKFSGSASKGGCGQQRSAVEKMRGGVSDNGGFAYRRDFCDRSEG